MFKSFLKKFKKNNLLQNIFNLSILQVVSAGLSLALIPLLARILEPTIFGLVMFIHLITSYFIWFAEWGFSQGGTQKIAINKLNHHKLSTLFNEIFSAQLFLIILALVPLYFTLTYFQSKYQYDDLTIMIILIYFILSSSMPIWFLNGLEKVTFAIIVQIYPKIIALLFIIFFLKQPEDFIFYFVALLIGLSISILHIFFVIIKSHKIFYTFMNPFSQLKNNFNYFISSFSKTMSVNIIPFFLGVLTSIELFGFYSLADKIKGAVLIILNPIYQSVFPRMCHVINHDSYLAYLKKYSILIILIISTISIILFFSIELIITYFVGLNYITSSLYIRYMIPAILINSLVSILFYFILIPFDLSKSIMKISLFNFIFIALFSYPVINVMEVSGAIIILTISELLFLTSCLYIIFKKKLFIK